MIEHIFGVMKQIVIQLYHLKLRKIPDIANFIRACAVLHNIALIDDFTLEQNDSQEKEPQSQQDM